MEAVNDLFKVSVGMSETNLSKDYHGIKIPEALKRKIKSELQLLFEEEKVYLDPKLTLAKLSGMIGTNTAYLSSMVNYIYHCNLPTLINSYRIDCAKRLLRDEKYNIKDVYKKCGFVSRSVFYTAFQKETGITPSVFVKQLNR